MKKKYKFVTEEPTPVETPFTRIAAYKHYWIRLGISLVALVVLYIGVVQYRKFQELNCKKAYRNADTDAKKKAFAYEFAGKPLAGKVALELGDKLYVEGKYVESLKYYDMASQSLVKTPLKGRVYLGKAMCLIQDQKIEQAEKVLKRLIRDPEALGVLRAEAALQALLLAIQKNDPESIQKYREELEHLPYSDVAKERIQLIGELSRCP